MSRSARTWMVLLALAVGAPAIVQAGGLGAGGARDAAVLVAPEPAPYGTAMDTQLVIAGSDVRPTAIDVTYNFSVSDLFGVGVYQTSSTTTTWWRGIQVPAGAIITRVVVDACDTSTTGELEFGLARGQAPAGPAANVTPVGTTGGPEVPGCAFFTVPPAPPLPVQNGSNTYWVFLRWQGLGAFAGTVRLHGIRIAYRLAVSPAPATATFPSDVPAGHAFFRFVEALAASGITAGCGPGSFCPDAAVTRGQMAVFLATALGLHFPD